MTKKRMVLLAGLLVLFCGGSVLAQDASLDGVEMQAMADTLQYSLENNPTNSAADWVNPDTARSGAVTPVRTFENAQGQPCREFITTIIIGDQEEQGYGTACRQPDGSWEIVNDSDSSTAPPPQAQVTRVSPPPPVYYSYPSGFWGPYNIFLSFDYVYRSGHRHVGRRYLDGASFRVRYPVQVRYRTYYGPRLYKRYRLHDEFEYRKWERRNRPHVEDRRRPERSSGAGWREKRRDDRRDDRSDDRDRKRGRGHD